MESFQGLNPLLRHHAGTTVYRFLGGSGASVEDASVLAYNLILKELFSGSIEAIGVKEGNKIEGVLLWQKLAWDSQILGIGCARVLLVSGRTCSDLLYFWKERAAAEGIKYVTIRVPDISIGPHEISSEDVPHALRNECFEEMQDLLAAAGFEHFERMLYLGRSTEAPSPARELSQACREDIKTIQGIAASSYRYDRFHREPFFSREAADRVHSEWARASFSGRADEVLLVRDDEKRIAGYCTCILPEPKNGRPGWIDMLAVSNEARRQGLGESLVLGALGYLRGFGYAEAALSTQDGNEPALKLYHKLGFEVFGAADTYRLVLSAQ